MPELAWIDGQANPIHHLTKFQERKNVLLDNNGEETENMVSRYAYSYPYPSEVKATGPPDYPYWYRPPVYHTYGLAHRANFPPPSNFVDSKDKKEVRQWRPKEEEAVHYGLQRKKLYCSCHESCEKMIPIT